MAVFMIKQDSVDQNVDRSPTLESSNEIENTPNNAPVVDAPENIPDAKMAQQTTDKELMVKIDGPVGRVFTDALNKLLVNESYMTTTPEIFDAFEDKDEDIDLQVYAWKADDINLEDVTEITQDIARHENRDFVIAVEGNSINAAVGVLGELSKLKNVKVVFSRENALNEIMKRVKR